MSTTEERAEHALARVQELMRLVPPPESVSIMSTTEERAEHASPILADCTISGNRGMLVLQTAEPHQFPVSPGKGRFVAIRLCAIIGVATLITGGLVWFPGMRQRASIGAQFNETPLQVAKSAGNNSPVAGNDLAAAIGKPTAAAPTAAPELIPTGGTSKPMQVANSVGKGEVRSTTEVKSPVAENDLAATIGKPVAAAPSLPAVEVAATGGTPKPASQPALAPVPSGPVSESAPPSGAARQLDKNEIAMLVTQGKDFLKEGDLVSARLLLQRAVAAGSAEAGFILGTTFDPLFIRQMGVVGIKPDIARAREWYKRAAELGSADASQQLTLPTRP